MAADKFMNQRDLPVTWLTDVVTTRRAPAGLWPALERLWARDHSKPSFWPASA
jgi:hypothetical protein